MIEVKICVLNAIFHVFDTGIYFIISQWRTDLDKPIIKNILKGVKSWACEYLYFWLEKEDISRCNKQLIKKCDNKNFSFLRFEQIQILAAILLNLLIIFKKQISL